jgi:hypothetical protein
MPDEKQQADQQTDSAKTDEGQKKSDGDQSNNSKGWEAAQQFKAENADLKKQLAKILSDKKSEEDAKLKESGKWQELATAADAKSKGLESTLRRERIERAIVSTATVLGAKDPEDLVNFIKAGDDLDAGDRDSLSKHFKAEIKRLKEAKPYLFNQEDVVDKDTTVSKAPAGNGKDANFDPTRVSKKDVWGLPLDKMRQVANQGK